MSNEDTKATSKNTENLRIMLNKAPDDLSSLYNRTGAEFLKIMIAANSVISPNGKDLQEVTESVLNSRAQSAPSFENVRTGINEKINKYSDQIRKENSKDVNLPSDLSLPQDMIKLMDQVQSMISDKAKDELRQKLLSEDGRQSLISDHFKQEACGNLTLLNKEGSNLAPTPQDKTPLSNFISQAIYIPPEILLLAGKDSMFAQVTLKNIVQQRIPEYFGYSPEESASQISPKLKLFTVDTDKFPHLNKGSSTQSELEANQQQFAKQVNKDVIDFTQRGLAEKIVLDIVPKVPENKNTYSNYWETINNATDKLVNLMSEAKVPLSTFAYPRFRRIFGG